jgi:hypothetical protein
MQNKTYRQGDILIEEIKSLPKGLKLKKDNILVHSDSTQHNHTLKSGEVYQDKKENLFLDVPIKTQIVHTMDHKPINLPKGKYQLVRQVEYLMKDMVQVVID